MRFTVVVKATVKFTSKAQPGLDVCFACLPVQLVKYGMLYSNAR